MRNDEIVKKLPNTFSTYFFWDVHYALRKIKSECRFIRAQIFFFSTEEFFRAWGRILCDQVNKETDFVLKTIKFFAGVITIFQLRIKIVEIPFPLAILLLSKRPFFFAHP